MDRRIKYTKKVIKESFISLLKQKEINKITVSEICSLADINRATFYRYYVDVYDLLEQIEKEFEEDLTKAVNETNEVSVSSFSKDLLNVLLSNQDLVTVLFNTMSFGSFLNNILLFTFNKCSEKWKQDLPYLTDEEIEFANVFIFNGALGVVNFWIQNGFKDDVEKISSIIEELSYHGTQRFIYKK